MLLHCCSFSPAEVRVACACFVAGLLWLVLSGPVSICQLVASATVRGWLRALRSVHFQIRQVSSAQLSLAVCSCCHCPATAGVGRAQLPTSAGQTSGPSAIRSRCSRSTLVSAARFSWTSLGSPSAASLGIWLAYLAQSDLRFRTSRQSSVATSGSRGRRGSLSDCALLG